MLLLIFSMAVYTTSQRHLQIELQNAVDASDLAATTALVDDYLLTEFPDRWEVVLDRARKAAQKYAEHNRVAALPFHLEGLFKDCKNCKDDELVFGRLDRPESKLFDLDRVELYGANAARVAVKRRGVAATSTAYVDRDVIGFKPQGCKPLPVIPLAVLTDPTRQDKRSWDYNILDRHGTFRWFVDPQTGRPRTIEEAKVPRDDNIPEMKVVLSETGVDDNGRVAVIGSKSPIDLKRQIQFGLTREDLQALGGQLVLNPQPQANPPAPDPQAQGNPPGPNLPGQPNLPGGNAGQQAGVNQLVLPRFKHLSAEDLKRMAEALQGLVSTGERRIWLLYSRIDSDKIPGGQKNQGTGTATGSMLVLGFVSAQVMHVEVKGTDAGPGQLCIILQPSMKITDTAVTDANRRLLGLRPIHNPYICKVRIVD
jgi:hypothetical protein